MYWCQDSKTLRTSQARRGWGLAIFISNSPPQCWLMSCWDPPERCNSFRLALQSLMGNDITVCATSAVVKDGLVSPSAPRTSGGCTGWCRSLLGAGSTARASCCGSGKRGSMKYALSNVKTLTHPDVGMAHGGIPLHRDTQGQVDRT